MTAFDPTELPHWGPRFYDREVWLLGDDHGPDDVGCGCVLIQGTDRRSYAALICYLGHGPDTRRIRSLLRPSVTPGRFALHRDGDDMRGEFLLDDTHRPDAVAVLIAEQ